MTTQLLEGTLSERFGFSDFRTGQREVIEALLSYGAALAVFPTGGGKSLCYQLPALMVGGVTLVVSPLIALMKDQIDFLTRRGILAARLDSSLTSLEVREIDARLEAGELKLLYVAPERFNNERFLAKIARLRIGIFAVDEAHCISEWGHNFRPDYLKLAETAREIGAERVLALTATATRSVVEDICTAFRIPTRAALVTGFYRPNLTLLTTPCHAGERMEWLVRRLGERPPGSTIVYVTLQRTAESVAQTLQERGFSAEAYHAGMDSEDRNAVQDRWMGTPGGIVVATIAFGMGIDKADVRYVYHYNLPKSLESYSQEIGRAGRDDLPSTVEMFANSADLPILQNFVFGDTPVGSSIRMLVHELLLEAEAFDFSIVEASNAYDLRPLVLRTAMTYLELLGALRRGTPFYRGYEFRPLVSLPEIEAAFPASHGQFAASLFEFSKKGRTWYSIDPDRGAEALEVDRRRVVRALEVMSERELVELRASDVRDRYTRLVGPEEEDRLVADLMKRFQHREEQEIARLAKVPELVEYDGCQVAALVGYFGQTLPGPCGHCTYCLNGTRQTMPALDPPSEVFPRAEVKELRTHQPRALGRSRQVARFLCGLTSPWMTKDKLHRHPLFGRLSEVPFLDVLAEADGLTSD